MRELAKIWFAVGTQSVGGGTSTLFLIRRFLVEQRGWLTMREYTEAWALSQLSPGIHIVALAGLLGRRVAGARGAAVSVAAMMIPACAITAAMTAAYGYIQDQPLAIAALAGVAPATGGMTFGIALFMARSTFRHGRLALVDAAVVIVAFLILLLSTVPSIAVIGAMALLGAMLLGKERPTSARGQE
jgi:chromate transporter